MLETYQLSEITRFCLYSGSSSRNVDDEAVVELYSTADSLLNQFDSENAT